MNCGKQRKYNMDLQETGTSEECLAPHKKKIDQLHSSTYIHHSFWNKSQEISSLFECIVRIIHLGVCIKINESTG